MKYFFISGESSGDHLSSLIAKELIGTHNAEIRAMGGTHLSSAGAEIVHDIDDIKVMGWQEVIGLLPKFLRIMNRIKKAILDFNPDTIVLVDFGSFNLRMAKWCKKQGYRVVYFIPPKVWASREGRIEVLKKYSDQIIVLFPFENKYFKSKEVAVEYFGYPLAKFRNDISKNSNFLSDNNLDTRPIISVLPGSRPQEIKYMLKPMVLAATRFQEFQICISEAEGISEALLVSQIPEYLRSNVKIIKDTLHQLLLHSRIAIVASGTATLECALLNTPMVVCYRTSPLNYRIAKRLIKVPFISLPNLILSENVVPELIQDKCTVENIYNNVKFTLDHAQLSSQRASFCKIYDNLYNLNTISSIAEAINNRG